MAQGERREAGGHCRSCVPLRGSSAFGLGASRAVRVLLCSKALTEALAVLEAALPLQQCRALRLVVACLSHRLHPSSTGGEMEIRQPWGFLSSSSHPHTSQGGYPGCPSPP